MPIEIHRIPAATLFFALRSSFFVLRSSFFVLLSSYLQCRRQHNATALWDNFWQPMQDGDACVIQYAVGAVNDEEHGGQLGGTLEGRGGRGGCRGGSQCQFHESIEFRH